jgi:hypothetical protein
VSVIGPPLTSCEGVFGGPLGAGVAGDVCCFLFAAVAAFEEDFSAGGGAGVLATSSVGAAVASGVFHDAVFGAAAFGGGSGGGSELIVSRPRPRSMDYCDSFRQRRGGRRRDRF